ncbi:MAG TPA: biotin/lipoyl-binding protein, partial [Chitinophagaceae bacterium]|nr:biotin/lipoyl-binding protein [Chitinophagaceae bacterium]
MKYLSSIIGITATMLFVLSACSERNEDKAQQPQPTTVTAKAFGLQKMRPEKKIIFPAELLPLERAEVFARVNGYIKSLPVDIGDRVQKGQVLLTMEAPEMIANYEKAKADVQTAHSTYLGSRDNYRRLEHAARVPGTVAAGELESARSRMLA